MAGKIKIASTNKVEKKAISAIDDYFYQSDCVETYIAHNDKEPEWDGNLYLYHGGIIDRILLRKKRILIRIIS